MLLFSYCISLVNYFVVRIRMQRVHAKGRGFSYTYLPQGFYQTPAKEISSLNERKRLSLCPLFQRISAFRLRQGSRKLFIE